MRKKYQKNPVMKEYLNKINNIAPSYKDGLMMNFF